LPGRCNLACSYCYACGGEKLDESQLLSWSDYEKILESAKAMGIDSIGIPGAGEPFVKGNYDLTMRFLAKCKELDLFVTLFTTGQFITEELARELYNLPVEIMLKGNSLIPAVQDEFVSNPEIGQIREGYGKQRNRAIQILIKAGFNKKRASMKMYGRVSRMALVTSIMTSEDAGPSNYDEMAEILRYCRKRNIIFDCDSLLKRGRGANCSLCIAVREIKSKLLELREVDAIEFNKHWELSQSYVGTVCDRYMHHMYIDQYGNIRPCIGAMDVVLGNIKLTTLENAWNSREMVIIRGRHYGGVCGTDCKNFAEGKCNSCLGRRARNLTNKNLLKKGFVDTIGCWNNRPIKN
jgi:MoaA/NifB/PqqE/SkfB family radical SAM enzyme